MYRNTLEYWTDHEIVTQKFQVINIMADSISRKAHKIATAIITADIHEAWDDAQWFSIWPVCAWKERKRQNFV